MQLASKMSGCVEILRVSGIQIDEGVRAFRKEWIEQELALNRGNQSRTARNLGKHRNTLSRDIAELKIDVAAVVDGSKRKPVKTQTAEIAERETA